MILQIFSAATSETLPPMTVKSWAKTQTGAPFDLGVAGDDGVAGEALLVDAEVGGAVQDEGVELLERAGVDEQGDALARGELAALVLGLDAALAAAEGRLLFAALAGLRVALGSSCIRAHS